jgi:hypothetical protein
METERIELSARERERLKVLQQVEEGYLQQVEAAQRLRLSDRAHGKPAPNVLVPASKL